MKAITERGTQLSELQFFDHYFQLPVLSISAAVTRGTWSTEQATNLIDDDVDTKWYGNRDSKYWTLTLTLPGDSHITQYQLITANDHPERDPTSFDLSCDGVLLDSKVSVTPPNDRKTSYDLEPFRDD